MRPVATEVGHNNNPQRQDSVSRTKKNWHWMEYRSLDPGQEEIVSPSDLFTDFYQYARVSRKSEEEFHILYGDGKRVM